MICQTLVVTGDLFVLLPENAKGIATSLVCLSLISLAFVRSSTFEKKNTDGLYNFQHAKKDIRTFA